MSAADEPWVEVAYALPERQSVVRLPLTAGLTAMQAVEAAGILETHPELQGKVLDLGIHGRIVAPSELLCDGNRIEIYRPLRADPRDTRRRLAAQAQGKDGIQVRGEGLSRPCPGSAG